MNDRKCPWFRMTKQLRGNKKCYTFTTKFTWTSQFFNARSMIWMGHARPPCYTNNTFSMYAIWKRTWIRGITILDINYDLHMNIKECRVVIIYVHFSSIVYYAKSKSQKKFKRHTSSVFTVHGLWNSQKNVHYTTPNDAIKLV